MPGPCQGRPVARSIRDPREFECRHATGARESGSHLQSALRCLPPGNTRRTHIRTGTQWERVASSALLGRAQPRQVVTGWSSGSDFDAKPFDVRGHCRASAAVRMLRCRPHSPRQSVVLLRRGHWRPPRQVQSRGGASQGVAHCRRVCGERVLLGGKWYGAIPDETGVRCNTLVACL